VPSRVVALGAWNPGALTVRAPDWPHVFDRPVGQLSLCQSRQIEDPDVSTAIRRALHRADHVNHKIYVSALQPGGSWGPATLVDELNAPGAYDARPNVRKDGLEIVFDSNRGGGASDIYSATRSSIYEPWSAPQPLGPNVNRPSAETRASLSRDGKRLYFG
jgi:hypothetical protein